MLSPTDDLVKSNVLIGETGYAKSTKELIQFVTTLRSLGYVHHFVQCHCVSAQNLHNISAQVYLDLPRIVVIGNQSAGKSSLVEAISGVSLLPFPLGGF